MSDDKQMLFNLLNNIYNDIEEYFDYITTVTSKDSSKFKLFTMCYSREVNLRYHNQKLRDKLCAFLNYQTVDLPFEVDLILKDSIADIILLYLYYDESSIQYGIDLSNYLRGTLFRYIVAELDRVEIDSNIDSLKPLSTIKELYKLLEDKYLVVYILPLIQELVNDKNRLSIELNRFLTPTSVKYVANGAIYVTYCSHEHNNDN